MGKRYSAIQSFIRLLTTRTDIKFRVIGFTLSEVIVSLLVSSIVLLSAISLYFILLKFVAIDQIRSDESAVLINFITILNQKIEDSDLIEINDKCLILIKDNERAEIFFNPEFLIKSENNVLDTIKIQVTNLKGFLDGNVINHGLIDEIQIQILDNDKPFSLLLDKEYDAFTYIKYSKKNKEFLKFE